MADITKDDVFPGICERCSFGPTCDECEVNWCPDNCRCDDCLFGELRRLPEQDKHFGGN